MRVRAAAVSVVAGPDEPVARARPRAVAGEPLRDGSAHLGVDEAWRAGEGRHRHQAGALGVQPHPLRHLSILVLVLVLVLVYGLRAAPPPAERQDGDRQCADGAEA
eukprot:scaffold16504_cov72-Phaeocystis_antarctica.AAC.5